MKKVLSIFAIVVFSIGLFSCEADNSAEDQALYEVGTGGDDIPDGYTEIVQVGMTLQLEATEVRVKTRYNYIYSTLLFFINN